jgi:DNA-binding NtrC family response regulator
VAQSKRQAGLDARPAVVLSGYAAPVVSPVDSSGTPYAILIVDDEEGIRESLELTLCDDYRVFTAKNAQEGLAIIERENIALVIADQVLPGMTGVEFLEKVIERNPTAIRMMLTGYADVASIVRASARPHHRYIPSRGSEELRVNVRRALESIRSPPRTLRSRPPCATPTIACARRTSICVARCSAATRSTA